MLLLHQIIRPDPRLKKKRANFPLAAWRAAEELTQKRTQGRSKRIRVITPRIEPDLKCAQPIEATAEKNRPVNKQHQHWRRPRRASSLYVVTLQNESSNHSEAFSFTLVTSEYCVFIMCSSASQIIPLWTAGPCASVSGGQTAPGSESQQSGISIRTSQLVDAKKN